MFQYHFTFSVNVSVSLPFSVHNEGFSVLPRVGPGVGEKRVVVAVSTAWPQPRATFPSSPSSPSPMDVTQSSVHEVSINVGDDLHQHLRDGPALQDLLPHLQRRFRRVIVMPNLKPPVRTLADAVSYHQRITSVCQGEIEFLMTLYLTDNTTSADIIEAHESGIVHAVKYYPAGATTNSQFGVTHIDQVHEVLLVSICIHHHHYAMHHRCFGSTIRLFSKLY
jgi:hypothetical protein